MKNVFDIRRDNENYAILSSASSEADLISDVVVIIYLYYADTVTSYFKYIDGVVSQNGIELVFVTPSDEVERLLRRKYIGAKLIRKENRGRDITALLIAAKDEILNHKYVCFVHDKKAVKPKFEKDAKLWIRNMWENTLASGHYVRNVVGYMEKNPQCGLLVPPEPFGEYYSSWFKNAWQNDYENTAALARRLEIEAAISYECPPISLGTVLWGRSAALKKLVNYPWKYTDFEEEPLPDDGTLSHAIERIFPYVAQDAGYETETVMTVEFAATLFAFVQSKAFQAYSIMRKYLEVVNVRDMKNLLHFEEIIEDFFSKKKKVYLYGAGAGGKACLHILRMRGLEPAGFIVSRRGKETMVDGLPVKSLPEIELTDAYGVIITVIGDDDQKEMIQMLSEYSSAEYFLWHKPV